MFAIQIIKDGEWADAGRYPETISTSEKYAREYADEFGDARIHDRETDTIVGTWKRFGGFGIHGKVRGGKVKKVAT